VQPWEALAYRLWRRGFSWSEISGFLAVEGWCVSPARAANAVLCQVGRELARRP
jgi:hypothetical protein